MNSYNLRNFNVNFNEARNTLEKLLTSEFETRCINYLSPLLSYHKDKEQEQGASSWVDQKLLEILSESSPSSSLKSWVPETFSSKADVEKNIIKIILEYIKIKDFPLTVYKGKLLELMKKFHKKFISDINECIETSKTRYLRII